MLSLVPGRVGGGVEVGVEWGGGKSTDCVQTLTPFTRHEALCNSLQLIWNKGEFP